MDSTALSLQSKRDSLVSLQLSTKKITNALDSIDQLRGQTIASFNEKVQSLKDNTTEKLERLNVPPEFDEKLSFVTNNISGFKIPSVEQDFQSINLPDLNLEKINGLSSTFPAIDNPLDNAEANIGLPGQDLLQEINDVTDEVSNVVDMSSQVGAYGNDVQQLANGDLSPLNDLSTTAETKAAELAGINDIRDQSGALEDYTGIAEQVKDPEALKKLAIEKIRLEAKNHFAGKEQQIQQAMETVSKYKKHYTSVKDVSKLPVKRSNEMKDKTLVERLVPGIAFQIQKEVDNVLCDFNPYVFYRITGRINGGIGWNQRIGYNTEKDYFDTETGIYGPRIFCEYNLWKGFYPRAEAEVMNAFVPPLTNPVTIDAGSRQWVWGAFVGIKKEYRFIKSIKGTALVMVRLFDPQHKSPYADIINARFGFEFPFKTQQK